MKTRLIPQPSVPRQQILDINVRPIRFGFVVNGQVKYDKVREVIQYNTSIWGGQYNLFVPTDGESIREDWWRILLHHDPDVIFVIGAITENLIQFIYSELLPLKIMLWNKSILDTLSDKRGYVNPLTIQTLLHDVEWQFRGARIDSSSVCSPVIDKGIYQPLLEMHTGIYPEETDYKDRFQNTFRASEFVVAPQNLSEYLNIIDAISNKWTPLRFSGSNLRVRFMDWMGLGDSSIVLTNGAIDDLFLYHALRWTHYRSSGRETVAIIPIESIKSDDDLKLLMDWYTQRITRTNAINLSSLSIELEQLQHYREKMRQYLPRSMGSWNWSVDIRCCNFNLEIPYLNNTDTKQMVLVSDRSFSFPCVTPDFMSGQNCDDEWITEIDLSLNPSKGQGYIPSMFTRVNYLLSGYKDNQVFSAFGSPIRVARSTFALRSSQQQKIVSLKIPSASELIAAALVDYGYRISHGESRQSHYDGIVQLLGGELAGAEFLRDRPFLDLFLHTRFLRGEAFTIHELKTIMKPGKGKGERLIISMIQEFAYKNILMRGMNLQCPACNLHTWYKIADIREVVMCQGCHSSFQIPLQHDFAYKLNMLFADKHANDKHNRGTLTVILTLLLLSTMTESSLIWQADSVLEKHKSKIEIDLISMCDGIFALAECKNSISDIDSVIEQLKSCITVAQETKARLFLFATLQQDIPKEIIDFINHQDEENTHLRVLLVKREDLLRGYLVHDNKQSQKASLWEYVKSPDQYYHGDGCEDKDPTNTGPRISAF